MEQTFIRNFCIIAHIDHGKSTLADRMLELTKTVPKEKMHPQMLDMMELEQERGITIKLQPVRMVWRPGNSKHEALSSKQYQNSDDLNSKQISDFEFRDSDLSNSSYVLNLIDTPGHVVFSYEVSRSLAAVEGALLVVDATKGIQAQTLANLHHARENNLAIIPIINKIDLPNAQIAEVKGEIAKLLNIEESEILKVSAKTGENVENILNSIIAKVPPPKGNIENPFKALIFDSVYDAYRGVIAYIRVIDGKLEKGTRIKFLAANKSEEVLEIGEFKLKYQPTDTLGAGEIGYIITGAKDISEVQVGDTICLDSPFEVSPITGYKKPQPMVYAGVFSSAGEPTHLKTALEKLKLNDSSLNFEPEKSNAFGQGFRCGFLGLLHLEIVKERLEREYNLDLIITQPSVLYKERQVGTKIEYEEPWVKLEIISPKEYIGKVMELAQAKRAVYKDTKYFGEQVLLEYAAPLSEIIIDFYDKLKSVSSGYASQNYEIIGWRPGDLVKLEVIVAGEKIEEFSRVVPRPRAQQEAKNIAIKLKKLIPRQMFEVSIQVAIGSKILAREDISAMKKDVTAKLYGGDRTRKDKLLKKQAIGKKKLKKIGKVDISSDVFINILKS